MNLATRADGLGTSAGPHTSTPMQYRIYMISGSGTNETGSELVNAVPRPETNRAVQFLNVSGHNATDIRNGTTHELSAGDVLVIPSGTGHQFTGIDDHIRYVMIRVDPDKVVPLKDEADSREYPRNR